MGLFNKRKNNVSPTQYVVNNQQDTRPYMPYELNNHIQRDCIKVYGIQYHQDVLRQLVGDVIEVAILQDKMPEYDSYPVVIAASGVWVGAVYDDQIKKSGLKVGYTALAEIFHPVYYGQSDTELYIRKTQEAIDRKKHLDSLKFWGTIDMSRCELQHGKEFKFKNVDVLARPVDGEKPIFVVLGDNQKLFEVNSSMELYSEIEKRTEYKPRLLIVKMENGENGGFYKVGFYY